MPESSAIAGRFVASAAARALISAFSSNVSPVSGGSSTSSGSGSRSTSGSRRWNSRSLWALRVASTTAAAMARSFLPASGLGLHLAQPFDPVRGEREQLVEVGAAERRALGGGLDLDEAAIAGHDHVGVDLRGRVLGVVEVEQRGAVDDPARDGRDRAGERELAELALVDEAAAGELERHVPA